MSVFSAWFIKSCSVFIANIVFLYSKKLLQLINSSCTYHLHKNVGICKYIPPPHHFSSVFRLSNSFLRCQHRHEMGIQLSGEVFSNKQGIDILMIEGTVKLSHLFPSVKNEQIFNKWNVQNVEERGLNKNLIIFSKMSKKFVHGW